jgi:trehalose utilization protein
MQNLRNPPSHNKSGLMGVSWFTAGSKWRATITIGGKEKHLGYFIDKQEAYETYLEAKRRLHEGCTI